MSLLTDVDLRKIIARNISSVGVDDLVISPYSEDALTPVGYDLRVGAIYATSDKVGRKRLMEGGELEIASGATALITTLEKHTDASK